MIEYSQGKIYIIRNNFNDKIYIGHTTQILCDRMKHHRSNSRPTTKQSSMRLYQAFREIGVENFYIELIENFPCNSVEELRAREGYWIRHYQSFKPDVGYNYQIAGRSRKEKCFEYHATHKDKRSQQWKEWYEKNKDEVKQRKKVYREAHKQETSDYNKEYAEKNKEKIPERMNQVIKCECGEDVMRKSMYLHKKSKRHLSKVSTSSS